MNSQASWNAQSAISHPAVTEIYFELLIAYCWEIIVNSYKAQPYVLHQERTDHCWHIHIPYTWTRACLCKGRVYKWPK